MEIKTQLQPLSAKEINMFLSAPGAQVARLATMDANGFPYVVPVHFIFFNGKVYIHGAGRGQKIDNLAANPKVGFEAEFMDKIYPAAMPCMANTTYTSIIAKGTARLVSDNELKQKALQLFVDKYLPAGEYEPMPQEVIDVTAVIEVTFDDITAKARIVSS